MTTGSDIAIRVSSLARRFGRRWALAGIDLEIPRGSAWMVTGANGSGKTTLARCLATALPPHRGSIRIFGEDPWVSWSGRAKIRGRIALLSHATRLYEDLSARENLRVWSRMAGLSADPDAALRAVGLDPDRDDPVQRFSAGMRRRAAMALALLKSPEILLLDEPLAALDPAGRALVQRTLADLRGQGITLVVVTHLPAVLAPYCDSAIHLEDGRIVWSGRPADAPKGSEAIEPDLVEAPV